MNDCIFCKIARKEISSYAIYEDNEILAFLDVFPCVKGQTLIISKKHIGYFIDLPDGLYKKLMLVAKKVSKAIQTTFNPVKVGIIIEGLEVEHIHIKLYPLTRGGFAEAIKCKPKFSKDDMHETAELIKKKM